MCWSNHTAEGRFHDSAAVRSVVSGVLVLLFTISWATGAHAQSPSASASTTWTIRDWTRVEMWRFFAPPPGGGDSDYAFAANRLYAGVQRTSRSVDLTAALQYVQFGGLPRDATAPGPLGTGANTRRVTQRPDNTGRTAQAIDVDMNTFGATVVAAPGAHDGRQWDALLWVAVQTGAVSGAFGGRTLVFGYVENVVQF